MADETRVIGVWTAFFAFIGATKMADVVGITIVLHWHHPAGVARLRCRDTVLYWMETVSSRRTKGRGTTLSLALNFMAVWFGVCPGDFSELPMWGT